MPYIPKSERETITTTGRIQTAGQLNFHLTQIVLNYFLQNGGSYQQINDIKGALEGCKDEFTRRIVIPYEDAKILANGDVYPPQKQKTSSS